MLTLQSFCEFLEESGCTADNPSSLWDKIRAYYQGRPFHSWTHIEHGWELLQREEVKSLCNCYLGIQGGWLIHDAIYDPQRDDNERKSADLARSLYLNLGMRPVIALASENFILATDHRNEPIGKDQCIIADVDLAELAVSWGQFELNTWGVREEYNFVSDDDFAAGRAKILQSFLDRKTIFRTPYFQQEFETRARENLERSILEFTA